MVFFHICRDPSGIVVFLNICRDPSGIVVFLRICRDRSGIVVFLNICGDSPIERNDSLKKTSVTGVSIQIYRCRQQATLFGSLVVGRSPFVNICDD